MTQLSDSMKPLIIGLSSRALFDLEEENRIFEEQGLDAYIEYQKDNEKIILEPGSAFPLIDALLRLNKLAEEPLVEVVIMSQNDPQAGLRVMHAIDYYNLPITRAAFSGGARLGPNLAAFGVDLYLSKDSADVQDAADHGVAAAQIYAAPNSFHPDMEEIRIAFDGDAVVFSEDSEFIYQQEGLEAFKKNEKELVKCPLPEGPFGRVIRAFSRIKQLSTVPRMRIALVTARGNPSHERVILTLRGWGVNVDEAYFLGGLPKEEVLKAFNPHIFFDDQDKHVQSASEHVPSARVPYRSGSKLHGGE
ncbi:MAG: 5'-nucleotidase [Spirochaeta sp. LUC14_002_19_P3]|nr:MAG: 5'-nucleotidase [Spirochaeta sp. LUC14_002_19_P3]